MPSVSVSLISRLRLWVTRRSVGALLLIWLGVYATLGLFFAAVYKMPECAVVTGSNGRCETQFSNLVYFSFTTQSTVGYGDYFPKGIGRSLSAVQGFLGLTLNALVLGIAVFKALKRSAPIVFADHLVYNMTQHHFWFRFMNTDADELRDVEVRIRFVQPKGLDDTNTLYDTQTSLVEFDYEPSTMVPPLRLFAIKTKSTGGRLPTPQSGDFKPLIVSPLNLVGSSGECIEITIRGYFEATGDLFFGSKRYTVNTIRCGNSNSTLTTTHCSTSLIEQRPGTFRAS